MCKTKSVSLNKQVSNNQKKYLNDCTKILVKEKKNYQNNSQNVSKSDTKQIKLNLTIRFLLSCILKNTFEIKNNLHRTH